ncbi:ACP S-malonyltransferase [Candidatus Laterigemmans baculatus]|uniref:ACP S-malonyltransferase n=1 Tax=Candidatus Laterigemmans baculatus TaxID=2770505 RepID=UPI0013DD7A47|nr:ACP S-malonyltransferase [Candidatus Laterigemmans baculatus]
MESQLLAESQRVGVLFPGQGAQVVGMGQALYSQHALVRERFAEASDLLGYDLGKICFEGPAEKLNATEFSQPALFVTSIVASEVLRAEQPELFERVVATAGLSLGEYTAVCFAGGLEFADALRLVQRRGKAMQAAADEVESGMCSLLGLSLEQVETLCREVRQEGEVLAPANLLCPGNIAVSGHKSALARLEPAAVEQGAMKVVPLAVAGAFHTPLMQPAVEALREALLASSPRDTRLPVYSNVDARPHQAAGEIRDLLARQVVSPVLWESSLRQMMADGVDGFLELGTGRVLRGTLKRIDRKLPSEGFGE